MRPLKSVSGVVHLPDARVNFYLNFDGPESPGPRCEGAAKIIGRILDQASGLPTEMQEILINFAEFLGQKAEK